MKRLLFALFVFGLASTATAQAVPCDIVFGGNFFKPATVALDYVESNCSYTIVYESAEDAPNMLVNMSSKQFTSLDEAITAILSGSKFVPHIDMGKKTITIRRVTNSTSPIAPAQPMPPTSTNSGPYPVQTGWVHPCDLPNMYTVPARYSPSLGMSEADWILARNRIPCTPSYPAPMMMATGTYAGNYQSDYTGYGGYMNPFAVRDFGNQEKYGLLKIDGPDKFLRNVRVLIDDVDVAVASKSNNSWNSPVIVTAGNHVVEFVRESKEGIVAFRRNVAVQPIAVTGRNSAHLRVSGNEFENARELYEYRQHRYVESGDGKIEPEPVTPAPTKK